MGGKGKRKVKQESSRCLDAKNDIFLKRKIATLSASRFQPILQNFPVYAEFLLQLFLRASEKQSLKDAI